jgi:hypothetical protein
MRLKVDFTLVKEGDPVMGDDLNPMAGHPDLVEFVERTLRTTCVSLMRAVVWVKDASARDFTQALHTDYMQDSLLYPSRADAPEQVTEIPYNLDVTIDLGPTYIVENSRRADVSFVSFLRPQPQYPALYELERRVVVATAYWEALIDYYATLAARPRDTGLARAPEATPLGVEAKR